MHVIAVKITVRGCAEMIFHIARAVYIFWLERAALKFVENHPIRFLHHICQYRKAAAMRHTDHNVAHPKRTTALDDLL